MKTIKLNHMLLIAVTSIVMGCTSTQGNGQDTPKESENSTVSATFETCPDQRPQVCSMIYDPVCGTDNKGEKQTYSSGCNACSAPYVKGFEKGSCEDQ
jgi:hypothetical protein